MKKIILLFFLSVCINILPVWAQDDGQLEISGWVVDDSTREPVPYATLQVEDLPYGAVANLEGAFSLVLPAQLFDGRRKLRVKSLGYETGEFPLTETKTFQGITLALQEHPYSLNDVVISWSDLSPAGLVRRAFEKIPENNCPTPYQLRTFYRHYCKEGDTYGRLIEAAVRLYDAKGHKKLYGWPGKKLEFKVEQLRRSFDFTFLYPNSHAPIALNKVLLLDWSSYTNALYQHPEDFAFTMLDTTYYDGYWVYVIEFKGIKKPAEQPSGELYLSADNLAFVKVKVLLERKLSRKQDGILRLTRLREWQTTTYQKQGDYFFLSHLINEGEREESRYDATDRFLGKDDHFHHVEMMTGEVLREGFSPFKGKEPDRQDLLEIPFDPGFWRNYPILQATPLERRIETDLASRMPLEDQYLSYNSQKGIMVLEGEEMFDRLLRFQQGRIVYVQVYSSLALGKLQATRRLAQKKYNDGRVGVLFVYVDEDGKGLPALVRNRPEVVNSGLVLMVKPDSPLLQRYSIQETPHFMIFDRNGKLVVAKALAPDEKGVESQIDAFLGE